ncbi:MAG: DsbA family protein [Salinispira sp.]
MNTSKKSPGKAIPASIIILLCLSAAVLAINLIFSVSTNVRVNRLHQFYNAFSADYRSLGGGGNQAIPGVGEPTPDSAGGAESITCADGDIDIASDPSVGSPDAPVVIVEYSDFECPFCARFVTGVYPQIKSAYIDSGQARLVFKDFPLDRSHPLAIPAAVAANCVARELGDEAFFAYHDRLFFQQTALSEQNIMDWAREAGLSDAQIKACTADSSMVDEILADRSEGSSLGISGTPSFVINGEIVVGAQPFSVFKQSIDRALERAEAGLSCGE